MHNTLFDMRLSSGNIFAKIQKHIKREIFEELFKGKNLNIYRIVSHGQTTDWLKQNTNEWVILLKGKARLSFKEGNLKISMKPGDYLHIPKGCEHKVSWTDPKHKCVWLAVNYGAHLRL
jgi:cupin 2 domain-containing protein